MIRPVAPASTDFETFYQHEFGALATVAGAIVGGRIHGEDIAQEALARVAQRWSDISRYDKPGAWARRVTVNLALNAKRRSTNEASAMDRLGRGQPRLHVAEPRAGEPEVWSAIAALPPRQRAAVALHYLEDRPVAEVADALGISVSTATSHLHKARKTLQKQLGGNR